MGTRFDDLTDVYEAMIDWPKRLGNESGFYRELFARIGAKRVLDVACGTGRHIELFHSWGLTVEGADVSAAMVERCVKRLPPGERVTWTVRGFDRPVEGAFDIAICVGNSLALAPDLETVGRTVRQMLSAVRPGGAVVVHVMNLWRLPDGPSNWQKCQRATLPEQGEVIIHKGARRCGERGYVDLLVTDIAANPPLLRSECVPFLGITDAQLRSAAVAMGGGPSVEVYGDYQRRPYDAAQSPDLLMVAIR